MQEELGVMMTAAAAAAVAVAAVGVAVVVVDPDNSVSIICWKIYKNVWYAFYGIKCCLYTHQVEVLMGQPTLKVRLPGYV